MMGEQRIAPEESARLHSLRHEAYRERASYEKDAEHLTDDDLVAYLEAIPPADSVFLSRRTGQRVKTRAYAQEAHRRGLLWLVKK